MSDRVQVAGVVAGPDLLLDEVALHAVCAWGTISSVVHFGWMLVGLWMCRCAFRLSEGAGGQRSPILG